MSLDQTVGPFPELEKNVGKEVTVRYFAFKIEHTKRVVLEAVNGYIGIETDKENIYFIGRDCIIEEIYDQNGRKIYDKNDYPKELAEKWINEREEETERINEENKILDEKARERIPEYIREGIQLVKMGKIKEWRNLVGNTKSWYDFAIIDRALKTMQALSNGKDIDETLEESLRNSGSLNVFGTSATIVREFHPKGEEYWRHFKAKYD